MSLMSQSAQRASEQNLPLSLFPRPHAFIRRVPRESSGLVESDSSLGSSQIDSFGCGLDDAFSTAGSGS